MPKVIKVSLYALSIILLGSMISIANANNSKKNDLQKEFFEALMYERIPVSIYLVNGIKLQGQIERYDNNVIFLKNTVDQMVYKHAISTVVPARPAN